MSIGMQEGTIPYERLGVTKERLIALSDGIFSIAITLLVLDLSIPEVLSGNIDALLLPDLWSIFPKIIGFVLSFFIIASYWLSYHRIFSFIREIDGRLLLRNIIFLFFIVLMPFPTYLLGLYAPHASVVLFYALVLVINNLILYSIWQYVVRHPNLLEEPLNDRFCRYIAVRCLIPAGVFGFSMIIALFNPLAAMISWSSLIVFHRLHRWMYKRGQGSTA